MEAVAESRKSEAEGQLQEGAQALTPRRSTAVGPLPEGEGKRAQAQSKWREISGITVENEKTLTPKERRAAIRKLKEAVEAEIRAELKASKEEPEFAGERTFLWEPIPAICQRLEISQAALTRLLKELTGMSATQMVDRIRASGLKEKLREFLMKFVKEKCPKPGADRSTGLGLFWHELKEARRSRSFSKATWAIELGFANYTRFYRACLLAYGQTPTQIEEEILQEFADWYRLARELYHRGQAKIHGWMKEYDNYRKPYSDDWATALRERPEYVARMRAEMELDEKVVELAGE